MANEKNLLENLPATEDEMSPEVFEAYSNALAKGEIEPVGSKGEEPKPKEGEGELSDEEKAKAAEEKAKAEADKLKSKENSSDSPSMSLSKYKHKKAIWESKLAEMEENHKKELEELKSSITSKNATSKSVEEDIKKFAEENDIKDVEFIKGLMGVITKNLPGLDPKIKKDIDDFKESQRLAAEEVGYEKDFIKTAEPILRKLNPNIDEAHLKEAKETLKKYAYEEKYSKLNLEELISLKQDKFIYNLDKKKTVETSRPGSQTTKVDDYENWTAEDIDNSTPEQFEKYSNFMASKAGSRLRVLDINGNEVK